MLPFVWLSMSCIWLHYWLDTQNIHPNPSVEYNRAHQSMRHAVYTHTWPDCPHQCCHSSHGVPPTKVAYFPLLSPTGPTINYNALLFVLPPFVGQGSRGGSFPAQRIMGISWKGGGGEDIHKHPPPLWTLSAWRHPPSGKLKNAPTLEHSQAPPPLDIARVTSSIFERHIIYCDALLLHYVI